MSNIGIFSHVPLWISHHAEAIEIALANKNSSKVTFYSYDKSLIGFPTNPFAKTLFLKLCHMQIKRSKKILIANKIDHKDMPVQVSQSFSDNCLFNTHSDLMDYKYEDVPVGRLVYSTIVSEENDTFFDLQIKKDRINYLINNSISIYKYFCSEIKTNNLDKLFVWNGRRSTDGAALHAAKNTGIDFYPFISGGEYNSILLRKNCETINDISAASNDIEMVIRDLKDPLKKGRLVKQGLNYLFRNENVASAINMNNVGFFNFHKDFSRSGSFESKIKGKKIITLFTGTYFEFAGIPGFDTSDLFFENFYNAVSHLNDGKYLDSNQVLVVRWHPNSSKARGNEKKLISELISSSAQNVIHVPPTSNLDSYWLIEISDKVVGLGSSIILEASVRGKPAAFMGHNLFERLSSFEVLDSWKDLENFYKNGKRQEHFFLDSIAWGVYFSTFGSIKFKNLHQKYPGYFELDGVPLEPFSIRAIKKIRKALLGIINVIK